jgi:hypothetical protein
MAEALPGLLTALGCAGFGAHLPDKALLPGVRQHVALPLTGEFPADIGVHEHGLLLSIWTWGFGRLDDPSFGLVSGRRAGRVPGL